MAAPVEVGVTTLSDTVCFSPEWARQSLILRCGEKTWEMPFSALMEQKIRITTDNGVTACNFMQVDWADAFLEAVDLDLRSPDFVNLSVPEGYCYQLADGFEQMWLGLIQDRLLNGPLQSVEIELNEQACIVMEREEAEKAAVLKEEADYILAGTCTTSFQGSSANRINNIRVAAGKLDGYVLLSGASASLNEIFTPRTAANGYKSAGTYVGGKVVSGMGGGICQVSSTTYNALMNAGITVTMRYAHSSPVHYLPLGMDAAISSGSKDLQFRNDYLHPVKIETKVKGTNLTVSVYVKAGDMNGMTYKLWSKKTSSMSAKTYLSVYLNGVEAEVREVGSSHYVPLQGE